ncbi:ABC transporter ATP-binding protein [Kitasatospora sp. NPDC008050]|uniref:ABC transporter ATP-binding protein n=1 Tax=Kitasatospora sp. NPDC008050 TaxID=3364021 RepID=UPI0036EA86C7
MSAAAVGGPPGVSPLRAVLRRHGVQVGLALVLLLVSVAASLTVPLTVRDLVEDLGRHRSAMTDALALVVLALLAALAAAWGSFVLGRIGELTVLETRGRLMRHVLRMPVLQVRRIGAGDLTNRVTADAAQLRTMLDVGVTALPASAVTAVLTLVIMGLIDPVLLLIVVATFAVAGGVIAVFVRSARSGSLAQQEALGTLAQGFNSALGALAAVKANRAEGPIGDLVTGTATTATDAAVAADRRLAFITPVMGLGQQIAIVGVLAGSGARLASGSLSAADFVAFMMYLFQLVTPLTVLATGFGRLQTGMAAGVRVREVLDLPAEDPGPAQEPDPDRHAPALRLRNLAGGYGGDRVLHGVSFEVAQRGLTALVGPSGAGKSTVLGMLERLLLPERGSAELHGVDLAEWPLRVLRRRIAYVDQEFTLLEATVRENLLLGRQGGHTEDELLGALAQVGLEQQIAALPQGLDTRLAGAVDLSGGQRQRLALARALLSEADVLLLDEPSSQLDGVNEELLRQAVDRLAVDRAVVVVAHRLSTVRHADQIVFLQDGRVHGAGTHDQLVADCLGYRALVAGQSGGSARAAGPLGSPV